MARGRRRLVFVSVAAHSHAPYSSLPRTRLCPVRLAPATHENGRYLAATSESATTGWRLHGHSGVAAPSQIHPIRFTVFSRPAYIYGGERHCRPPRPENQRDDREADSRRGPNPQRGEPSCRSHPRISSPSPAFSPPATCGTETSGAPKSHLILLRR